MIYLLNMLIKQTFNIKLIFCAVINIVRIAYIQTTIHTLMHLYTETQEVYQKAISKLRYLQENSPKT